MHKTEKADDVPSSELVKTALEGNGLPIIDLLVETGLAPSKGSLYLNNQRITDAGQVITLNQSNDSQFIILRKGRKKYQLVRIQ